MLLLHLLSLVFTRLGTSMPRLLRLPLAARTVPHIFLRSTHGARLFVSVVARGLGVLNAGVIV